jgi:putative ABC transport system permease protein
MIAWPIAYYVMKNWLESFAYRINVGLMTLVLSGVLALSIALLTVAYQSIKAARANPVNAIQQE